MKSLLILLLPFLSLAQDSSLDVLNVVNNACVVSSRLLLIDTGLRVEHVEEVGLVGDVCIQQLHDLYNDQASISYIIAANLEKKNDLALQLIQKVDLLLVIFMYPNCFLFNLRPLLLLLSY